MFDQVAHFLVKVFLTGALALIIVFALNGVRQLWSTEAISLEAFTFYEGDKVSADAGRHFSLLLLKDIHRLNALYSSKSPDYNLLPSADQIGRTERLNLLKLRESDLPNIEITAYGVRFSAILKSIRAWLGGADTINGTVTHGKDGYDGFAEMSQGATRGKTEGAIDHWYISSAKDLDSLSFGIATRLFRRMTFEGEKLFASVPDEDFESLSRAVVAYERYRVLERQKKGSGGEALEQARVLMENLLSRHGGSPLYFKLAAYIYREKGNLREASAFLETYLQVTGADKLNGVDDRSRELLQQIREQRERSQLITGQDVVRPGGSIGPEDIDRWGTICCIVRDPDRNSYALTTPFAFWSSARSSIGVKARAKRKSGESYPVGSVHKAMEEPSGGLLVKLNDGVSIFPEAPVIGAFSGLGEGVTVGDSVRMIGARSGVVEGKVLGVKEGEFITTKLASAGDAGAPVIDNHGYLIGMVWGGDGQRTFVTRAPALFANLDVQMIHSSKN